MFLELLQRYKNKKTYLMWLICFSPLITTMTSYADIQSGIKQMNEGHFHQAFKAFMYEYKQGNPLGATNLAVMYEKGLGVKQDPQKALYYYKFAANKGIVQAMTNIGYMYQTGEGIIADNSIAIKWYLKSIKHGMVLYSARNLADLYYNESPPNFSKALYYYRLSASKGNPVSMYKLGIMSLKGNGIPINDTKAYEYFYKAHLGGITLKPTDVKRTEAKLTPKQRQIFEHGMLTPLGKN